MDIYALSHDETLTIYPLNDPTAMSTDNDDPPTDADGAEERSIWGDVRQKLGCEYVVDLLPGDQTGPSHGTLVVGSHVQDQQHDQWIDLIPFRNDWSGKGKGRMSGWRIDLANGIRLAGGHGEEVVRCIRIVEETATIFTGGEDGLVKVWKGPELNSIVKVEEGQDSEEADRPTVGRERGKKKHGKKHRTLPN